MTLEHIIYLKRAIPFIQDSEKKQIVLDIITEIKDKGYADCRDIQIIVENYDTDITSVNILNKIKTTGHNGYCDGFVFCLPGLIRSVFWSFWLPGNIAVAYAIYSYKAWDTPLDPFGWHFTINGERVSEGFGFIIGFYGLVQLNPPMITGWYFKLDGTAVLIFHIVTKDV